MNLGMTSDDNSFACALQAPAVRPPGDNVGNILALDILRVELPIVALATVAIGGAINGCQHAEERDGESCRRATTGRAGSCGRRPSSP